MVKKLAVFLFSVYGILLFVCIMLLFFPFIWVLSQSGKRGVDFSFILIKTWAWLFSVLAFIRIKITRSEKIRKDTTYMYVSNHTSFLDAISIVQAIPGTIRPLGKKELKKIPILGMVISQYAVFVDRKNRESRKKSIEAMLEVSRLGDPLLIFPEGTMNRSGKPLQPFYEGAYRIAREAGVDIVPAVIRNAGRLLPPGKFALQPGTIEIEVGDPIRTEGKSVEELREISYNWIAERLIPRNS